MGNTSSMCLYVKFTWDADRFLPAESKDYKFHFAWVQKYVG